MDMAMLNIDEFMGVARIQAHAQARFFRLARQLNLVAIAKLAWRWLALVNHHIAQLANALERIKQFASPRIRELLVVEDDPAEQLSIAELIGFDDVSITAAGSGAEALTAMRAKTFDCVVLDLRLPDVSGFELQYQEKLAIVTVSDDGPGIAREHLPKIFDPFFTTRQVGAGAGLGLSLSNGIVEEHGGTISVESEPGAGATFVVELPALTAFTRS